VNSLIKKSDFFQKSDFLALIFGGRENLEIRFFSKIGFLGSRFGTDSEALGY
jgi:hypothetical protein